jgi:hypothetical protein
MREREKKPQRYSDNHMSSCAALGERWHNDAFKKMVEGQVKPLDSIASATQITLKIKKTVWKNKSTSNTYLIYYLFKDQMRIFTVY